MKSDAKVKEIPLDDIRIDGGTQARASLNDETVQDYYEKMLAYVEFPPLVVFFDGSTYWLADGFHRYHAMRRDKRPGRDAIACDVRTGDRRDAILFACGANSLHGLPRTREDRRRAIRILVADEEWGQRGDNWIATACHVSHNTVAAVRSEVVKLTTSKSGVQPNTRKGRDGKSYPAKQKPREPAHKSATAPQAAAEKEKPTNIIGDLKNRLDEFISDLTEGLPAHVKLVLSDHLECIAQSLRK